MSPRQADQIIKAGKPVQVHNPVHEETFVLLPTHRDRWNIYGTYTFNNQIKSGVFDRGELEVLP